MKIHEVLEKHELWLRQEDGGVKANLRGENLCGINLIRANLIRVNLSYADLSGAKLIGADLSDADLRGAKLIGANLSDANLLYADLSDADLSGVNLIGANLSDVDLSDVDLSGANLSGAILSNAILEGCVGDMKFIKPIQLDTYPIAYTSDVLQIGCKRYSFDEWRNFSDQEIIEMDGKKALEFWRKWKDTIFQKIEMSPAEGECK